MHDATPSPYVCSICLTAIAADGEPVACPGCAATHHLECWTENGGCGVYGCAEAPAVAPRAALEIPVSHWGQEEKPCPSCQRTIAAAAVRCRHCGATFASATPQDQAAFRERQARTDRQPATQRMCLIIFVLCLLPCVAPVGVLIGAIWYPLNYQDVRALRGMYGALLKIGILIGIIEVASIIVMSMLYGFTSH